MGERGGGGGKRDESGVKTTSSKWRTLDELVGTTKYFHVTGLSPRAVTLVGVTIY